MTTPIDVLHMTRAELKAALNEVESYPLEGPQYAKALVAEHNRRRDAFLTKWIAAATLISMVFVILSALRVVG